MRRSSYNDKATSYIRSSQTRPKSQFQLISQLGMRLDMSNGPNPKHSSNLSFQQRYLSSRTAKNPLIHPKPSQYYQQMHQRRPYTTQKTNSLSQLKRKQDVEYDVKQRGYSTNKDVLFINAIKNITGDKAGSRVEMYNTERVRVAHDSDLMARGKIHRGISTKYDEKAAGKLDYSLREDLRKSGLQDKLRESSRSRTGNRNGMDLVGKNLHNSFLQKDTNFLQYVMRFSYKTKKGHIPSNPNKINQDSYIISPNIGSKTWQHLFGICDGHGPLGHLVSDFVKVTLPLVVEKMGKNIEKNPITYLAKAFQLSYDKLIRQSKVDMSFSGSTVICCYFVKDKLYCCNVGDSRAIMGKCKKNSDKDKTAVWQAIQLSTDHKPSLPLQAQRIRKCKGRVQAYKDEYGEEIGPLRVWLKHDNVPGLAMTRSFGDLVGASVGVSHQPQITCNILITNIEFNLDQQTKILIIGSDGVFEFLDNNQIIKQMQPFYLKKQIQQASQHLLAMAYNSWCRNSSIIDDITFVLIFMNYDQV